ncbi:hypothetical protein KVD13_06670 [Helicobacter pylori]|nr:hypothetical protein KVD13_06670 [Helicobacter pylori]
MRVGVSVMDRSFCSRIACVFSLSSLEFFLSRYFVSVFVLLSHSNAPF